MYGVSHFALIGVDIIREGDAFHCEMCDHILLRDSELSGGTGAHETVKINQSPVRVHRRIRHPRCRRQRDRPRARRR